MEIFDNNRKISMDDFIKLLSKKCPELDGGLIFLKANKEWKHGMKIIFRVNESAL